MSGIMSGAALTHEINSWNEIPGHIGNTGHMFMAMDISKMMELSDYVHSVETMIEQFKNAKKAEGVGEIFYPGELEQRRAAQAGDTVSMLESTWQSLEQAFASCGLEF